MLEFETWTSVVEPTFWHALANLKLNQLKLSESVQPITSYFSLGRVISTASNSSLCYLPACNNLDVSSLNDSQGFAPPPLTCAIPGQLKLVNTLEVFRTMDKQALFQEISESIWKAIQTRAAFENPASILQFLLIAFADLKKHHFYYWFAYPSFSNFPSLNSVQIRNFQDEYQENERQSIRQICRAHFHEIFFVLNFSSSNLPTYEPLKNLLEIYTPNQNPSIVFSDSSSLPDRPAWPLRNLLAFLSYVGYSQVQVLCCRQDILDSASTSSSVHPISLVLDIQFSSSTIPTLPKSVGWERSLDGKLAPKMANLSHMMDPKRLAESAVNLNLKLMKWRLLPNLDLDSISQCKCLLLGVGTLGCHVARNLLAWGVQTISLVDNGKVSFSNPVRQPLYVFEDCLEGGISKCTAAAKRLKEIYPNVIANGFDLSIPMPGHPILDEKQFLESLCLLESLFRNHDAIFILLDSREGRWLPTLLGAVTDKIVINAALGFDSFVVMRHSSELGCYFCNDVVAPINSLSNRTLDQQCTVTRPGLSAIAGAYAVETLITILNHPDRHHAKPFDTRSCLGALPHQLRGFLNSSETITITGQAYPQCTACSQHVLSRYRELGADFIREVCCDSKILESITGLNEIILQIESFEDFSLSDDETSS